jgi:hypothetical protein
MPGGTNYASQTAGSVLGAPGHVEEVYLEGLPLTNPVIQGETRYLQEGMSIEAVDQFQLVAGQGNTGDVNYNSLQIIGRKTISSGLIVDFNYTFAKALTDTQANRSGYINQKVMTTDPPQTLNVVFAYRLPFGNGQRFTGGGAVVRAIASRWELSGVTTYRSGTPFGSIGPSCNLPNAGSCYANFNPSFSGPVRINGSYGSGDLLGPAPPAFLDKNAFVSPAAYTYGNTPARLVYGLHNPANWNQNVSLRREFRLREGLTLRFQGDAINVLNHVIFSGPSTSITSSAFGTISGQANLARVVQFNARIMF